MTVSFDTLFRESQHQVLQYKSGKMAVIAVPGSGKTYILAHLAAKLVSRLSAKDLEKGREILLVTFSNSAVKALQNRIVSILQTSGKAENPAGYRVRTLHGLARDIIAERPALLGLTDDFRVLDEQITHQLIQEAALAHIKAYEDTFDDFMADSLRADDKRAENIRSRQLPELAVQVCKRFIKHCKDHSLTPLTLADQHFDKVPLVDFALHVYEDYQRRLAYQSAVDFDDLVMLALTALQEDEKLKSRMQKRWTYVLEDEAQDSSLLQERLLRLLSAEKNWVRVGDPNQSINSTFTTADPQFLRAFAKEEGVTRVIMNQSGRSGRPIMDFANALVKWSSGFHPVRDLRSALDYELIQPVPIGDPKPNPATNDTNTHIFYQPGKDVSPEQELQVVMTSLTRWLPEHPAQTVAVLVPENRHGYQLAEILRQASLPYDELLRTTVDIRQVVKALLAVMSHLADPSSATLLAAVYRDVWWEWELGQTSSIKSANADNPNALRGLIQEVSRSISQYKNIEDFLWPAPDKEQHWLANFAKHPQSVQSDLEDFRKLARRWLSGFYLPADQLVLTIGRDIFRKPGDLAIVYKLASFVRTFQELENGRSLRDVVNELRAISENQRRYLDLEENALGYQPTPGIVTISTLHASKGLEWDRVYILGVNNRAFPEGKADENLIQDRWFVRDQLNLEAEIIAMLDEKYNEGEATEQARIAYAAERLRLLYVGITRACKEVILLWNMGHQWRNTPVVAEPALALKTLKEYLDGSLSF